MGYKDSMVNEGINLRNELLKDWLLYSTKEWLPPMMHVIKMGDDDDDDDE